MEMINTKIILKARKKHKCNFCNGIINIGESYEKQVLKYDDLYIWKSHLRCKEIANKLSMWEFCDEGVNEDDFFEYINLEYIKLQGDKEDYPYPEFQERLEFVCNHHLSN